MLAERLGRAYRDTAAARGRTVADGFMHEGEPCFRESGRRAQALAGHEGALALGGGAALDTTVRAALVRHPVVRPSTSADTAVRRLASPDGRPLLTGAPGKQWRDPAPARRRLYAEVARAVVATRGLAPSEMARLTVDTMELKRE